MKLLSKEWAPYVIAYVAIRSWERRRRSDRAWDARRELDNAINADIEKAKDKLAPSGGTKGVPV